MGDPPPLLVAPSLLPAAHAFWVASAASTLFEPRLSLRPLSFALVTGYPQPFASTADGPIYATSSALPSFIHLLRPRLCFFWPTRLCVRPQHLDSPLHHPSSHPPSALPQPFHDSHLNRLRLALPNGSGAYAVGPRPASPLELPTYPTQQWLDILGHSSACRAIDPPSYALRALHAFDFNSSILSCPGGWYKSSW